jgi:hypothetical protein
VQYRCEYDLKQKHYLSIISKGNFNEKITTSSDYSGNNDRCWHSKRD